MSTRVPLSDLGLVESIEASLLRVVFNPQEPGALHKRSITLDNLMLSIYNADTSLEFSSGPIPTSLTFEGFEGTCGVGQAGFVFKLDALQAEGAGLAPPSDRIGLHARLSNVHGGPETLFLMLGPDVPSGAVVPEPSMVPLLGSEFAGLGLWRWYRTV